MPITPFQIVNPDGSTNQEEYNRCMEFLQSYIAGTVQVYPELVWDNPYEINEDSTRSSLEILLDEIYGGHDTDTPAEVTNRLLTADAFSQFRRFFRGFVKGISRTLIPDPFWLANMPRWVDNTSGFNFYNPFDFEEPQVIWNYEHLPYVDNPERELIGVVSISYYNNKDNIIDEVAKINFSATNLIFYNIPGDTITGTFPNNIYTNQYDTYLPGTKLIPLFYRSTNCYAQTPALFYYSYCDDELFTSGYTNYYEPRLNRSMYFTIYTDNVREGGRILTGFNLSDIADLRTHIISNNRVLDPSVSTNTHYNPNYFDLYRNSKDYNCLMETPQVDFWSLHYDRNNLEGYRKIDMSDVAAGGYKDVDFPVVTTNPLTIRYFKSFPLHAQVINKNDGTVLVDLPDNEVVEGYRFQLYDNGFIVSAQEQ